MIALEVGNYEAVNGTLHKSFVTACNRSVSPQA